MTAPLVLYGGNDQKTRDVSADKISPHPTGVDETIIVEDGVNQAGSSDDPLLSGGTATLRGRVMGVFDHRDGTREIHVCTRATLDEPSVASYEEFKAQYHKMTGGRGVASEEKLRSAFHTYVSSCASSADQPRKTAPGFWLSAPGREMARWRREVKLEEPSERPVTIRDLLVCIAGFALNNKLVRLDHQFKGHLFEAGDPIYDFKRGQVKAINKLHKTVVKTGQGCMYVPRKMRDGYVFVDRSCGDAEGAFGECGLIRWYEDGGGNPKYAFWVEDGKISVDMA